MNTAILRIFLAKLGFSVPAVAGPIPVAAGRALTQGDNGAKLVYTGAADGTFTLPKGLAPGFTCTIIQTAAGTATVAAAAGATVAGVIGVKTFGLNAVIEVQNTTADKYVVTGGAGAAQ
ncbi:hypothetical protein D3C71_77990 [compost metagenome]